MPLFDGLWLALALLIIISGSRQIYNILVRGHAPFIFSRPKIIQAVLNDLTIQPGEVFYELGAGTAPLARRLAKRYPENQFVAIEYAIVPYLWGRLLSWGCKNLAWQKIDFYQADLSSADYLYCFLNVGTMRQLENKLLQEGKAGATIISYVFKLPHCSLSKTIEVGSEKINFYLLNKLDK